MLKKQYQRVLLLTIGLWFTVLTNSSPADDVRISAKSRALAHYIMAVVDDLNGEDQKALGEYEKTAKLDHLQPLPHLRLGTYYARLGRINEAENQFKTVIKLQPELTQARYMLALIYSSQKKYDLAAEQYELILKTAQLDHPDNTDVYSYLAQLYFAMGKYAQAQVQLSRLLEFQPRNVSALFLEGSTCLELNQKEKAKEDFRKVLELEPEHDGALNSLAYIYAEEGVNLDEAARMARKSVGLDPSNGAYYDTLGWVLFKQGFSAESLMALEKAQEYITDPIVFEHMGDVYLAANEPALARKFWLKSLALNSKQIRISQKLEHLNKTSARNQGVPFNSAK